MAEYKYKALGWKDDDIASLNVVDGTADNQVELQITKQGAGGTIDGPAIVGKDGITIDKAADSEKIEISGSGLVQKLTPSGATLVYAKYSDGRDGSITVNENFTGAQTLPTRNLNGELIAETSDKAVDKTLTNKKYVDDNYVKKVKPISSYNQLYGTDSLGEHIFALDNSSGTIGAVSKFWQPEVGANPVEGHLLTNIPVKNYQCANKKYVDDNFVKKVKFTNLEQALYGYILDTTKEAYADLDSAVLKNSVAVGNNVYPIADKTRALVTRVEGKTTKMVQLLDKSKFSATTTINGVTFTNNGDGTITVNGTATETASLLVNNNEVPIIKNHIYCVLGSPFGGSPTTYNTATSWGSEDGNGIIQKNTRDLTSGNYWIHIEPGYTANNLVFIPQVFDLTAMNREDITTAEQFKAEFPDLYPYENGNIYPAKIGGVKFYEKQDKSGEQASVTLPETYDLHGIGNYKDYLEITKNEDNELYTLKKVQVIDKHVFDGSENWSSYSYDGSDFTNLAYRTASLGSKFINWRSRASLMNLFNKIIISKDAEGYAYGDNTAALFIRLPNIATAADMKAHVLSMYEAGTPYIFYGAIVTPVETVIATNLTYEQVTAIRHNGGLIEVAGNTNKGYARPTVTNTIVYRLTAANTVEG